MANKQGFWTARVVLSLTIGLFLLLAGIQAIAEFYSPLARAAREASSFLKIDQSKNLITWIAAIFQVVAGLVLVIGPFGVFTLSVRKLAFWIIVSFWAALTVWSTFLTGSLLKPTVLLWLKDFVLSLAILSALWQTKPEK